MVESVSRDHHSLREESRELSGGRPTRLWIALVSTPTPAYDLRWFLNPHLPCNGSGPIPRLADFRTIEVVKLRARRLQKSAGCPGVAENRSVVFLGIHQHRRGNLMKIAGAGD